MATSTGLVAVGVESLPQESRISANTRRETAAAKPHPPTSWGRGLASIVASTIAPARWRVSLFRALALLVSLAYLPGVLLLIAPWAPSQIARDLPKLSMLVVAWASATQPDSQRWAWGLSAVVDAAIAVVLLSLAWRPLGRPLLPQFLALALVVAVGANIAFVGPGIVVGYSALLLVLLAYPRPRRLLTPFWRGPVDPWMLALAAVVGAFLLPDAWRALQAQVQGADELSLNFGWASLLEHLANLWLIALLAASRRPGANLLALLAAGCFLYLGVAAIAVPDNPGSWGLLGGAVALTGCAGYVAMILRARARGRRQPRQERSM